MIRQSAVWAARTALVAAGLMIGLLVFSPGGDPAFRALSWAPIPDFAVFYGLAVLAFAAFPKSRRSDLALALIALGVLAAIGRQAIDGQRHLYAAAFAAAGVLAVHLPTHLETVRKRLREPRRPVAATRRGTEQRRSGDMAFDPDLDSAEDAATTPGVRERRKTAAPGQRFLLLAAWSLCGAIVVATLGPQAWRPHLGDPQTERFCAYFLAGWVFSLAYPKRPMLVALTTVLAAVLLELAQFAAPGRDPGLPDAIAKALGGLAGVAVSTVLNAVCRGSERAMRPGLLRRPLAVAQGSR